MPTRNQKVERSVRDPIVSTKLLPYASVSGMFDVVVSRPWRAGDARGAGKGRRGPGPSGPWWGRVYAADPDRRRGPLQGGRSGPRSEWFPARPQDVTVTRRQGAESLRVCQGAEVRAAVASVVRSAPLNAFRLDALSCRSLASTPLPWVRPGLPSSPTPSPPRSSGRPPTEVAHLRTLTLPGSVDI